MGTVRGNVFIGRPLDLTIAATLDAAETDPCAGADLFFGQQRVGAPTVRWESRDGKEGVLRVTSELLVDEPMVTVFLRVGCGQPSSRRYVLLAAVPPEEAPGSARRAAAAPVNVVPTAPAASTPAAPASPQPRRTAPAAAAKAPASARSTAAPAVVPRPPAVARPAVEPAREPARSVLRLEPGDLAADTFPGLRLSSEIGTQPTSDPAARQAAAAMWQALQKGPEEAMQEALRLQALQRQLQSVRDLQRQNAVDVADMRAEMERAQSERSTAALLAAVLAALLAAVLGALAWRWYRIRRVERVGRWFEANGQTVPLSATLPSAAAAARAPVPDKVLATAPAAARVEGTAPVAARPAAPAPTVVPWSPSQLDFQASRSGGMRMVGVEELMDVHDKADFFMSIGDVDEAVAVLEGHVHDQVETSALPWLDLLGLYHSLGRRPDFDRLRAEFREHFAVQVPDFEHFDQPTPTLENYGRALSRIVELWPTRRVLDVIEESIFRRPGLPGAEAFSLEAYRELALLYHIATDVSPAEDISFDAPHPTAFGETSMQSLQSLDAPDRPAPNVDLLLVPRSANVGVDVDVTAVDDAPDTLPPVDVDLDVEDEMPDPGRGHA
ncbi:hypothetical protein WG902_03580 [Ramlibacter sp. PS3R-8]|uniref:hypothetical protein n=1 Tax=Ramlibacter sp. PS3R-8 TaxID=3133437 RepID=UPI0030975B21